ncbi:hypothetical protein GYMLUDRAFT_41217 [Collybiopsis luxurians FD-317 M1]|uniref:Uncharacterized protein n=1 Tax=Collybiopsis luxurians FD-317 M1 TaxID=944289 RepID=A0A0D0D1E6_9AGAR|nr:hypothetical protein GYMLUDRAFT_41217 [Collybiopsis luxurians FD-317 M1]
MAEENNTDLPKGFDQAKLDQFVAFMQNEIDNPPKASELFIAPDKPMSQEWSNFFAKILKHIEYQCRDRSRLLKLQKRKRLMENYKLTELEMIASATKMKFEGNEQFKQDEIPKAFSWYLASLETFPMPDVMLNAAACALKPSVADYSLAETYCTEALDLGLLSNPIKAYFRRCQARRLQGKFEEANEDIKLALAIDPRDSKICAEAKLLEQLSTQAEREAYLADVEKAKPGLSWTSFSGAMGLNEIVGHEESYVRIPQSENADLSKMQPPTF